MLKKILLTKKDEESFFEDTKRWADMLEIYRLKADQKSLRKKKLEQRRKQHL